MFLCGVGWSFLVFWRSCRYWMVLCGCCFCLKVVVGYIFLYCWSRVWWLFLNSCISVSCCDWLCFVLVVFCWILCVVLCLRICFIWLVFFGIWCRWVVLSVVGCWVCGLFLSFGLVRIVLGSWFRLRKLLSIVGCLVILFIWWFWFISVWFWRRLWSGCIWMMMGVCLRVVGRRWV